MIYQKTHFDKKDTLGGSIADGRINPDLQEERDKCNFDREELLRVVSDERLLQHVADFERDIREHPEVRTDHTFYEMDREEQMKFYWQKLLAFYKLDKEKYYYNWRGETFNWGYLHPGVSPLLLHFQMFQVAVEKLASEE